MQKIATADNQYWLTLEPDVKILDKLPAGIYTLIHNDLRGYYLEKGDEFELPTKIYSSLDRYVNRINKTFLSRPAGTGVLLSGEKGSGKTLTAKMVCTELLKQGVPTILINAPYIGDQFNQFIQGIPQAAVIFFDEFEKVYNEKAQPHLYTLLDGVCIAQKLYLFTVNDKYSVGEYMHNRPGRIYYNIQFDGLDQEFIAEYSNDQLINKKYVEDVVQLATAFEKFNFDMLKTLIEEMNRYGESPEQAVKLLNAKLPVHGRVRQQYVGKLFYNDEPINTSRYEPNLNISNPLYSSQITIWLTKPADTKSDGDDDDYEDDDDMPQKRLNFKLSQMVHVDAIKGRYVYVSGPWKFTLNRCSEDVFSFDRHSARYANAYSVNDDDFGNGNKDPELDDNW